MKIAVNVFSIWEEICLKMINNRDSTMAALLFAIVLVFFVCHTPKAVINIYEVILEISFLDMHAMHTSEIPFYCMYVALLDHTHGGVWIYPLSLNPIQSSGVLVVELWMWKATKEVLLGVLRALSWYSELNYRSANGGGILRKDAKQKQKIKKVHQPKLKKNSLHRPILIGLETTAPESAKRVKSSGQNLDKVEV